MDDLAVRIKTLYPSANLLDKVVLLDDGSGSYISKWDDTLGPQPTGAELLAVTAQDIEDYKDDQWDDEADAIMDDQDDGSIGALLKMMAEELGLTEAQTRQKYKVKLKAQKKGQ